LLTSKVFKSEQAIKIYPYHSWVWIFDTHDSLDPLTFEPTRTFRCPSGLNPIKNTEFLLQFYKHELVRRKKHSNIFIIIKKGIFTVNLRYLEFYRIHSGLNLCEILSEKQRSEREILCKACPKSEMMTCLTTSFSHYNLRLCRLLQCKIRQCVLLTVSEIRLKFDPIRLFREYFC